MAPLRLLLVEDSSNDEALLIRELKKSGFDPIYERVETEATLLAALERQSWDIVIADYNLPSYSGMAALKIVSERNLGIPFILVSGSIDEDTAVEAMRAGAKDYMLKGKLHRLGPAIERELREAQIRKERSHLQQQLLHTQRIESVGRLAGGIAHDFNNILSGIIGYSEQALTQLAEHPVRPKVHEIREIAMRAASLTRQLLDFSRKQILQNQVLDVNNIITDMTGLLQRLLGRSVELICRLQPELKPVLADRSKLEQVIMNLVLNARDAMPSGGNITIETRTANKSDLILPPGENNLNDHVLVLSVHDCGTGMSEETRAHVFEPYFTTKPEGKGTGLGLATVYGIVKQTGGVIDIQSKLGVGTTFTIYLPTTTKVQTQALGTMISDSLEKGQRTVLITEDDPMIREIIQTALTAAGYQTLVAADSKEALAYAKDHNGPIHLLLTDVNLPGKSGLDMSEEFRAIRSDAKVLFMSGYAGDENIHKAAKNKKLAFIAKPFRSSALIQTIQSVLLG